MKQAPFSKTLVHCIAAITLVFLITVTAESGTLYPVQPLQGPAFAQVAPGPWYPYGAPPPGMYGERRGMLAWEGAVQLVRQYFPEMNVKVILVQDRPFYFIADVLDKKQRFIDRVIIDKRTGRIRSIYCPANDLIPPVSSLLQRDKNQPLPV